MKYHPLTEKLKRTAGCFDLNEYGKKNVDKIIREYLEEKAKDINANIVDINGNLNDYLDLTDKDDGEIEKGKVKYHLRKIIADSQEFLEALGDD